MSKRKTPIALLRIAGIAIVLFSLLGFAIALGPSRAARIAGAAAANVLIDGFAERPVHHRIPVLELRVAPQDLDSLQADLPWSGGEAVKALLLEHGVEHKARFRYRGAYTPSHFLGGKKSFRLSLKRGNPWSPYRRVNVVNPKAHNLVNNHMAAWVAGSMGVPVPMDEMVFVRINDEDIGVMELFEQVDGDFERNRHLGVTEVPVYKGDYPAITRRELPKGRTLWADAAHWEYASDSDSSEAHGKLMRLVSALRKDTASLSAHRDSIAALVDVDTWLRYEAALLVINSTHIDQYHNQWLVLNPRTGRFYPVLWDALLMFAPPGEPLYYVNDAMTWWTLRIPEWRLKRDRYAYEAMVRLQREGEFEQRLDEVTARMRPSVLADRNKFGNVSMEPADVHRVSVLHVIGSIAGLRASCAAHWERTLARMERDSVTVERDTVLRVRAHSEAPIRLRWQGGTGLLRVDGSEVRAEEDGQGWSIVLHHRLRSLSGKDHPLADKQRLTTDPLDALVSFGGPIPPSLAISNAITDDPIQ